jgi:hypothetical protein
VSWYVVWTGSLTSVKNLTHTYHVVQLASPPAVDSPYAGQTVVQVQGPFATKAAAEKAIGAAGTSGQGGLTVNPDPSAPQANQAPTLGGLAAIGDFFARLTEAAVWERIGEVVLGLLLIAVGVAKLTHAVPVATKIAKTAGTAAVLA